MWCCVHVCMYGRLRSPFSILKGGQGALEKISHNHSRLAAWLFHSLTSLWRTLVSLALSCSADFEVTHTLPQDYEPQLLDAGAIIHVFPY